MREAELSLANLRLTVESGEVTVGDDRLGVPPRELAVLRMLMRRAGHMVSREALENGIYDMSREIESNALEAAISRLRKRLAGAGAEAEIQGLRGAGYFDSGEVEVSAHPSIRRRIIWRLSALFLCALVFSSALFLYEAWIHRVGNLDRGLREAAVQLAGSVQRDSAGTPRIPGAILGALQTLEIPSLRYVALDPATGAVAVGSTAGLIGDIAKLPLAVAAPGGFNFWDASGASERGYVMTADSAVGRLRVVVASPNLSFGDTMAWMRDEVIDRASAGSGAALHRCAARRAFHHPPQPLAPRSAFGPGGDDRAGSD